MIKTIIFDFDGTLTCKSPNAWKAIWKGLGYSIDKDSYFAELFTKFLSNQITHKEWCSLTCDAFIGRGMNKQTLEGFANQITLIDGFEQTMKILKKNGFSLHIVSGNIREVICDVLGDKTKYFDSINANIFEYDKNGYLAQIHSTNYDYAGKAKFIDEFSHRNSIQAKDILFVGNGNNDEWAHLSGCRTLCINPEGTDYSNKTIWHKAIVSVPNLTRILPELNLVPQKDNCF